MEIVTAVAASLLTLLSPVGLTAEKVAESTLRSRLAAAEVLKVRIDNAPSYRLAQGRVERLRIAGRGIFPLEGLRIAVLEVETDPLHVPLRRQLRPQGPIGAGIRLQVTEADLNRALRSPVVTEALRRVGIQAVQGGELKRQVERYLILEPRISLLRDRRLRFEVNLRDQQEDAGLNLVVEFTVQVQQGRRLALIQPVILINGDPVEPDVVARITDGFTDRTDLQRLEANGILARILQLDIDDTALNLAVYVRVAPEALQRSRQQQTLLPGEPGLN